MDEREEATGLAHVATVSFLAARLAPSGHFWLALAGGTAVARSSARGGFARGVGVSLAGMLQTVALVGPLRVNAPLTQALSAPVMGAVHRRGGGLRSMFAACLAIRAVHYVFLSTVVVWIALGGIDAYVKTYERLTGWTGFIPQGRTAAIIVTLAQYVFWAVAFSLIQSLMYRRALLNWPREAQAPEPAPPVSAEQAARDEAFAARVAALSSGQLRGLRFDPRALALAAVIAFAFLLVTLSWQVLAAVGAWLLVVSLASPAPRDVLRIGLALALLFAFGTAIGGLLGSLGTDEALRRALRAFLLVMVATWLRGAAGPDGMREIFRRLLARVRRWAWARTAGDALDGLDEGPRLANSGRALMDRLSTVPASPVPVADAVIGWVAAESEAFRGPAPPEPAPLQTRFRDGALILLAALPALALVSG